MSLMQEMGARALKLGIPLSVQLDVTYRCNERCVHCYLDHNDYGEMTTAEIKDLLDQLAAAGVFFLVFSGGEVFLRIRIRQAQVLTAHAAERRRLSARRAPSASRGPPARARGPSSSWIAPGISPRPKGRDPSRF